MKRTKELLPNLIVLTFPKTGSTSLHAAFSKHPEICLPNAKETWFFDQYFEKGISWYAEKFVHCQAKSVIGEVTTDVSLEKNFTKELEQVLPDRKL